MSDKVLLRSGPSQAIFFQAIQDGTWLIFVDTDNQVVVVEITGVALDNTQPDRQTWKFQGYRRSGRGLAGFGCTGWYSFRKGYGELNLIPQG